VDVETAHSRINSIKIYVFIKLLHPSFHLYFFSFNHANISGDKHTKSSMWL